MLKVKKNKNLGGIECLNCGQPLHSNDLFCSNCAQKNDTRKIQLSQLLSEFFSSFYSLDSRFLRTIIPLITKPGKVTKEYVSGKRMTFMNPFRFYINISIIFFLLQGIFGFFESFKEESTSTEKPPIDQSFKVDSVSQKKIDSIMVAENIKVKDNDSTNNLNFNFSSIDYPFFSKIEKSWKFYKTHKELPIADALDSLNYPNTLNNRLIYKKSSDIIRLTEDEDFRKKIASDINSNISIALFLMLPFFALFYKLVYIRSNFSYMEHLIFIFHTQSVFFLYLIFFFLVGKLFNSESTLLLLLLCFGYYLYKGMRNFYLQTRTITLLKYSLLVFIFFVLSLINLSIISLFSFVLA